MNRTKKGKNMDDFGFVKVAAAVPIVQIANTFFNTRQIEHLIVEAESKGVQIVAFPELSITGYSCADLFGQQSLSIAAEKALSELLEYTKELEIISIVGMPILIDSALFNCAVVIQKGEILGVVPKTLLCNQNFDEKRWFVSACELRSANVVLCGQNVAVDAMLLFQTNHICFGIEFGNDLFSTNSQCSTLTLCGAELIVNLSALSENMGESNSLKTAIAQYSASNSLGYVYVSAGSGESTTDVVFAGRGWIFENGDCLATTVPFSFEEQLITTEIDVERIRAKRIRPYFSVADVQNRKRCTLLTIQTKRKELKLTRKILSHPFIPQSENDKNSYFHDAFNIQVAGLATRLLHINCQKVVIGISGGLDSTLALLVCVQVFDRLGWSRSGIVGVTMPGFGTTDRTYNNALKLMSLLGITQREISIKEACIQHFKDIEHDITLHDSTYENTQARERTQILMDLANQLNALVVGTGDLSELALGWATYNGDHMSMYGVNSGVPKTLVKSIVMWFAQQCGNDDIALILNDIVATPISPELIPVNENGQIKQKTEDLVGPYELHDFFLYYVLKFGYRPRKIMFLAQKAFDGRYKLETILHWLKVFYHRFFQQQFKRSCLPDGPKICSISLSPRGGWSMPSDAVAKVWLNDLEEFEA